MAIYHFQTRIVGRSRGQSAITVAARRSGTSLFDERLGLTQRPLRKDRPVHSEILLPVGAPPAWRDRLTLWSDVEARETRCDSQLAPEVEISLPCELSMAAAIGLARSYSLATFVARGMAADLNVWVNDGRGGAANPWASLLLTMRVLDRGCQGAKVRHWNDRTELIAWRAAWAESANQALRAHGLVASLDHRSHAARGIDQEPQNKIGPAALRRARAGERMERVDEHAGIARRNAARVRGDPCDPAALNDSFDLSAWGESGGL